MVTEMTGSVTPLVSAIFGFDSDSDKTCQMRLLAVVTDCVSAAKLSTNEGFTLCQWEQMHFSLVAP